MNLTRTIMAILVLQTTAFAQDAPEEDYRQDPALGIHFFLMDFETATKIRNSSLSSVLANKQFGKTKDMSPGLAISYSQGLSNHFDFSATFAGGFVDYHRRNLPPSGEDHFLMEVDASFRGKLFSNKYWFTPYFQAGAGVSKYKGYYGAFIPLGVGVQFNFFDEAYLLVNSQYRVPATESANYHFFHSIGLAGSIGKRKPR